ncbi:putative HIT-like protein [Polaribacter huanghezhanensis]|uniref:HIT family protein n=1 Tax=Polaribacter huanghezhanensis TaxID=1354726 RepID=UPI0026491582|nr:HIT family protein [Polaribacter huanghezhanensis]WKD85787.1 putative HIT-like protein [Polaribacter huanghezhanensis]
MSSIFTKIINQEIPSYKIAEDDYFYAFLDINPNAKGHTLVIPKKEVDKLFDLDAETYLGLMQFAQKVAKALEKTIPCNRIGMSVVGLEVPHAHVHLIPINRVSDINFTSKKLKMQHEDFVKLADEIAKNI